MWPGAEQRLERHDGGRRVAARAGHERRVAEAIAIVLGQAVDSARLQPERLMGMAIPRLVGLAVAQAEKAGSPDLKESIARLKAMNSELVTNRELDGLVLALDARYVPPSPSGEAQERQH